MTDYIWLIPFLPGLAAIINGVFGRWLKTRTSIIAITAMVLTFFISLKIFTESIGTVGGEEQSQVKTKVVENQNTSGGLSSSEHQPTHIKPYFREIILYRWISAGSLNVDVGFQVDNLSIIMILFISFVGSLVFIYSIGYMTHHGKPDPGYARFFSFLSLFAFSMYMLVLANNFVLMFVGWEGVGLCSYLLIGYYMDKDWVANAGKKAFIVNRVGDTGFILGIFLIFWTMGSVNFSTVFNQAPQVFEYGGLIITAVTLLLFLGACGKSAQIPLFIWLPDAMAGPTPVSALIHAATMVTAGVYMVARCNILYSLAPLSMEIVALIGVLTAFVSAFIGITQRDFKRILAYSTISQLGYMFLGLGVGAFAAGIFHVFTHSFFKACLFLCAGSVIHTLNGEQDIFNMGGLKKKMPITAWTYIISALAISGVPLWSGFFSKDEILWATFNSGHFIYWALGVIAAFMTAFYMFRSVFLTFFGECRASEEIKKGICESPSNMTVPLIILAFFATIAGFFNIPEAFIGKGAMAGWFHHYLAPVTDQGAVIAASLNHSFPRLYSIPTERLMAFISILISIAGIFLAYRVYVKEFPYAQTEWARKLQPLYSLSFHKVWWDDFYHRVFDRGTMAFAGIVGLFDLKGIDGIVNGIGSLCEWCGSKLRKLQTGRTQDYALWMLVGIVYILVAASFVLFSLQIQSASSLNQSNSKIIVPMQIEINRDFPQKIHNAGKKQTQPINKSKINYGVK